MLTDIRQHYRFSPDDVVLAEVCVGCRIACFESRQVLPPDRLPPGALLCYLIEGTGLFARGQQQDHISAGGLTRIPAGEELSISNGGVGRLVVMIVDSIDPLTERDAG